ncbi:DUF4349 domain-containing protein [Mucisphaera sp.]|uniref:DUF4349 domain-containing protein n=1 Tax=Mucisphaera sp. TaxID=2913024 RepID=UPI003D0ADB3D
MWAKRLIALATLIIILALVIAIMVPAANQPEQSGYEAYVGIQLAEVMPAENQEEKLVYPSHWPELSQRRLDATSSSVRNLAGQSGAMGGLALASSEADSVPATVLDSETPTTDREIIYTATLRLAVENVSSTLTYLKAYAESLGGHMEQQGSSMIRFRLPPEQFDTAIEQINGIGEVRDQQINAQDVTSQVRDIEIELQTATTSRERLLALLEKAERVEDIVQIERELRRLNTQIDQIEGRRRYFADQVAMSTITVMLNAKVPQEPTDPAMPFVWVDKLAFELLNPSRTPPTSESYDDGVRIDLPEAFVRHYQQDYVTMALAADGVGLKIIRHQNYDEASLDFWLGLARNTLIDQLGIPVDVPVMDRLNGRWWGKSSTPIAMLEGTKTVAAVEQSYLLGLVATDRYVYTIEAWGPAEALANHRSSLVDAMMTLRVR